MVVDDGGGVNSFDQIIHFGGNGSPKVYKISGKGLCSKSYTRSWSEYRSFRWTGLGLPVDDGCYQRVKVGCQKPKNKWAIGWQYPGRE